VNSPFRPRFLIISALSVEHQAIVQRLQVEHQVEPFGAVRVTLKTSSMSVPGIAMPLPETGRINAAIATTEALHLWHPEVILVVGIAGGFESAGVSQGDILVATEILDFEHQRVKDDGAEIRWRSFVASKELMAAAVATSRQDWLHKPHKQPQVHFGPLLSGDKIVASNAFANRLRSWRSDSIGIEMEGSGVASAVRHSEGKLLMIRGVSDLADHNKSDTFQGQATGAAADFAKAVLCEWFSTTGAGQDP
jgi:nucleoside phosphorylase